VAHRDGVDDGLLVGKEAVEPADGEAGFGGNERGGDLLQRMCCSRELAASSKRCTVIWLRV